MTTATNLKREIFDLEKQYWEASKTGNPKALGRLTNDQFTFVMGEGIMQFDRPSFVDMMTKEGEDHRLLAGRRRRQDPRDHAGRRAADLQVARRVRRGRQAQQGRLLHHLDLGA